MDAFEEIVGKLLMEENYWVRHSVKINLTKEEKIKISKPTATRPEIDLVAFNLITDTLYLIETKSYLDSSGVKLKDINQVQEVQSGRYKLLTSHNYRDVLSNRLQEDWKEKGLIKATTKISYGLVAGKVHQGKEEEMIQFFKGKQWFFWGPSKVKTSLKQLVNKGYENSAITVISKLLIRDDH